MEKNFTTLNENLPTHIASTNGRLTAINESIDWNVLDDTYGSDHFPVLITFKDTHCTCNPRTKYNINKANWLQFRTLQDYSNINENSVDEMVTDFTNRIIKAADTAITKTKPFKGKRKLPYWNDTLKEMIKERKKEIRKYKQTLRRDIRENIQALSNQIREEIKTQKSRSWKEYVNIINGSATTKEIFQKVKTLNGKTNNTDIKMIKKDDNQITTDRKEILNCIKTHMKKSTATVLLMTN